YRRRSRSRTRAPAPWRRAPRRGPHNPNASLTCPAAAAARAPQAGVLRLRLRQQVAQVVLVLVIGRDDAPATEAAAPQRLVRHVVAVPQGGERAVVAVLALGVVLEADLLAQHQVLVEGLGLLAEAGRHLAAVVGDLRRVHAQVTHLGAVLELHRVAVDD